MANYIGGSPNQARAKYFLEHPGLLLSIVEISNRYDIDPYLLLHRIAKEGIVDTKIRAYNRGELSEPIDGTALDKTDATVVGFGTDWGADRIKSGNIKLNRVIPFLTHLFINEHNEEAHPATPFTNYDLLEIVAAQLKSNLEKVKKDWPNVENLHAAIMAYYNAGDSLGKRWVKDGSYVKYALPKEFENLLLNISPNKTPVIHYGDSEIFKRYYNSLNNNKWYPIPIMLQYKKEEPTFLTFKDSELSNLEKDYINSQKDKAFREDLGITKMLADSIMNSRNYLNFFK